MLFDWLHSTLFPASRNFIKNCLCSRKANATSPAREKKLRSWQTRISRQLEISSPAGTCPRGCGNWGDGKNQMVQDSTGVIYLADYGQYGNKKIQAIDSALIEKGDAKILIDSEKTLLTHGNSLWVSDVNAMILVEENIYRNEIREYEN